MTPQPITPDTNDELTELIGTKIGEASMCWDQVPGGVFDSQRAKEIVEEILSAINQYMLDTFMELIGRDGEVPGYDTTQLGINSERQRLRRAAKERFRTTDSLNNDSGGK